MAFTVEDGSGISGANAYAALAFVDGHHADRGNTRWEDYSPALKQAGIVRATDYIDKRFGKMFRGSRKLKEQGLEWPRLSAFDDDGFLLSAVDDVPRKLQMACAEYALRALIYNVLAPDALRGSPDQSLLTEAGARGTSVTTGEVLRRREVVGPIEEETWYQTGAENALNPRASRSPQSFLVNDFYIPEYPEADLWLEELLVHPAVFGEMVRS